MKLYNVYIMSIAVLLLLTTVILVGLGETKLTSYSTLYIIEALIVTELFVYFNARARHGLNIVSGLLFGGFVLTVVIRLVGRI